VAACFWKSNVSDQPTHPDSPWPHRLALALVCATFPLVWVGGLVTTHDAGMAVPDWPNTYGYNLFLYPWTEWIAGPWDLFIEHAHRLFAASVGMLCIAFVISVWRTDCRRWMRAASLAALALVIGQGILGGMRVLFDERVLAMIHGCVGPLFFTYCVLLATMTSHRWREPTARHWGGGSGLFRAAATTAVVAYLQLVLGAQLRHVGAMSAPPTFRLLVVFHLTGAAALAVAALNTGFQARFRQAADRWLSRPATWLVGVIALQIGLGGAAWVVNYGWPAWLAEHSFSAGFVVGAKGHLQANITTAHVALGSLILAISSMVALRAARVAHSTAVPAVRSAVFRRAIA
jgi:cytochrome c oxidase assembly protein subunit 15